MDYHCSSSFCVCFPRKNINIGMVIPCSTHVYWVAHHEIPIFGRSVDPISFHRSRRLRAAAWHLDLQLPHHCLRPVAAGPWAGRHHARPPGSGRTWWRTTRRCGAVRVPSSGLVVSTCFNKMFQRCFDDLLFFFLRIFLVLPFIFSSLDFQTWIVILKLKPN